MDKRSLDCLFKEVTVFRSFEKGLADRGGWREDTLQRPEIQASFLHPFSYAPLGEGGHISGEIIGLFLGVCLSPTPSRQPLFETSEVFKESVPESMLRRPLQKQNLHNRKNPVRAWRVGRPDLLVDFAADFSVRLVVWGCCVLAAFLVFGWRIC